MADPITKYCPSCKQWKTVEGNFSWSRKKRRPTMYCKDCWVDPKTKAAIAKSKATEELLLYYAHIRSNLMTINSHQTESIEQGLPVERIVTSLGDIFFSELNEQTYREIITALADKAKTGDVNATKLLLEERHRMLGEPTPEGVEDSLMALFNIAPLTPGLDTE